jgi:hypothetical protein
MQIGIISDTHYCRAAPWIIPDWIEKAFSGSDMIIHAGDLERPEVTAALSEIAPVYVVRGNCDYYDLSVPEVIGVKTPAGLLTVAHRAEKARASIENETRIMVYGHTHLPVISEEKNLLVINPGSPVLPRGGLPPSIAVVKIENGKIIAELRHK